MSEPWPGEESQPLPKDEICVSLALENVKPELVSLNHLCSVAMLMGKNGAGSWSPSIEVPAQVPTLLR